MRDEFIYLANNLKTVTDALDDLKFRLLCYAQKPSLGNISNVIGTIDYLNQLGISNAELKEMRGLVFAERENLMGRGD